MLNIFKKAQENKYAIGAFNVSNLEQIKAIFLAAQNLKSPIIISASEGEAKFIGKKHLRAIIDSYKKETGVEVILHQDHGKSFETIKDSIDAGYDSVQFDGSKLSFEENVEETKRIVEYARSKGVKNVEAEFNHLEGQSALIEKIELKKENFTDPSQAKDFVERTGVDALAVVIGNLHGVFKDCQNPKLDIDRLKEIREAVGQDVNLVLHGGSGIAEDDIKEAVKNGIVKINVNTELRMAYTNSLKKTLEDNPDQNTPYKIMPLVVEAVQKVVEDKIKLFGSDNKL